MGQIFQRDSDGIYETLESAMSDRMNEIEVFHGTMDEKEAEAKLREHSVDCFLVRYNEERNVYLLSVMTSGDNGHEAKFEEYQMIIYLVKDFYGFQIQGREEVFDSIDNLLKFYQKNSISQTTASIGEPLQSQSKYPKEEKRRAIIESTSYHGRIDEMEARAKLSSKHYLTRYDVATKAYMLSVMTRHVITRHLTEFQIDVKRVRIKGREEVFHSIDGLLKFYELNPISQEMKSIGNQLQRPDIVYKLFGHSSVANRTPPFMLLEAFSREPSYHGEMKETDAEKILRECGVDCYLTRFSETNNDYVLTVLRKGQLENFLIDNDIKFSKLTFEIAGSERQFNDLRKLLKFYKKKPISRAFNGIGDYVQSPDYEPPDEDEDESDGGIVCQDLTQALDAVGIGERDVNSLTKSLGNADEMRVGERDVNSLTKSLSNYSYKWGDIGTSLDFLPGELKSIAQDNPQGSTQHHLKELLYRWAQWPTDDHREEPTVDKLCHALRSNVVGLGAVASNIERERNLTSSQLCTQV